MIFKYYFLKASAMALMRDARGRVIAASLAVSCLSSCTDVPSFTGIVVDKESGHGIAGATIVVSYFGHTLRSELPMYRGAMHTSGRRCFVRTVVATNPSGTFYAAPKWMMGHAGNGEFEIYGYEAKYRGLTESVQAGRYTSRQYDQTFTLELWKDASADKYNTHTGDAVDYEKVTNPQQFKANQLSRHVYLMKWLTSGGVAYRCEHDINPHALYALVSDRFREWAETIADSYPVSEKNVCDTLRIFETEHPQARTDVIQPNETKLRLACGTTRLFDP